MKKIDRAVEIIRGGEVMTDIKLIQGDCLEKMKDIPDGSVDCAVIDPPYKIVAGGCRKVAKNECSGIFNKRLA